MSEHAYRTAYYELMRLVTGRAPVHMMEPARKIQERLEAALKVAEDAKRATDLYGEYDGELARENYEDAHRAHDEENRL